jgi:hypothetical protein
MAFLLPDDFVVCLFVFCLFNPNAGAGLQE